MSDDVDVPRMADAPVLVLVAVQDLVNLASCIRIAKNFGIMTVRLVQPECDVDFYRIEGVAHNTADLLDQMTIHDTLDDAFADLTWVVGAHRPGADREADHDATPGRGTRTGDARCIRQGGYPGRP